jgi:peptidoglycan-associated lipoprotein
MNIRTAAAFVAAGLLAACSSSAPVPAPAGSAAATASQSGRNIAPGSEEDLAANVGDRVLFDFDKAVLTDTARAILDKQAAWLARYPQDHVLIAGNTDERGTEEYNVVLGQRRANVARDYLVAKGVAADRIATISYGKDRPVALASNETAWAQNRNAITSVQ